MQRYTPSSKSFPHDPRKVFTEYFPKAPPLGERPFVMDAHSLRTAPRRSLTSTSYRENFKIPQTQGIQENPDALFNIRGHSMPMNDSVLEAEVLEDRYKTS